jgi:hypothetical protein
MELTSKSYKTNKIKNYIKTNHTFFLFSGNTLKSYDWISTEQNLKTMQFEYYKIFNKAAIRTLDKSVYKQIKTTINGITFFIKPDYLNFKSLSKQKLINNLEPLFFSLLVLKINNKIYSKNQLKNTRSLNYKTNKLLLSQFGVTYLKFYYT